MNIFRVPFSMERLIPGSMTGSFDMGYLSDLRSVCLDPPKDSRQGKGLARDN